MIRPVAVIGAGPYGLSAAAHLMWRGVPVRVFGSAMASWRERMPAGMLLKSTPVASSIDAPQPGHRLVDFCADTGTTRYESDWDLIRVEDFAAYGDWFAARLLPGVEDVRVVSVDRTPSGSFELKLDSGEVFEARAVVVATGLSGLARMPYAMDRLAADPTAGGLVSHTSHHRDLTRFAGQDVVVVGAGQSALENAVLMAEAGASSVRIVARTRGAVAFGDAPDRQPRLAPVTPFGNAWSLWALSNHATRVRHLPAPARHYLVRRVLGPLGAWWLRDRFTGRVRVTEGRRVVRARARGGRPVLTLSGGGGVSAELTADHVMAATGYRMDVAALGFLGSGLRAALVTSRGAPVLDGGYGSSVPGLHFTGIQAASSFGPLMRFVVGTEYASPRLAAALSGRG
ncbi:FAD-dependent oxidoreductase [Streptomyces sp. NBC_00344]|uniref:FAD-dependent oxidoreductase n=1 Tax=Streptomyces sp. NBC_00344 TaxID=2975720 RepID=UPI002E2208EE